ncbi:MAG: fibronectin type III domain-containing protein [Eubacteriales bacterium]|nr:fibronectin type III domain-containing protein [Eubacteriales bacterium]
MNNQQNMNVSITAVTTTPINVTANAVDASNIQITWEAAAGAAGYHVFRSTAESGTYAQVGSTPATAFTDMDLTPNTTYFYQLSAYDTDGDGPLSAPVSATTAAAPDAPQNLTATAAGPTQINTTWDPVAGATRYNVYRSTTDSGPFTLAGLAGSPSFTDAGLTPGTLYYYRVAAVAGETEGALSNIASAATEADIPMPTNVLATPVSQTQINTTWNTVPNATAYAVYRSTTPDGTYQYVGTTSDPSFSDTGLSPDTTYYYKVSAIVNGVAGTPSAYAAATTFPVVTPPCGSPVPPCRHCCPRCGCNPCCCHRGCGTNPAAGK